MELDKKLALKALSLLDEELSGAGLKSITLAVGGGGSMILQHGYDGTTVDIDAVPTNADFNDVKPYMETVAQALQIEPDWLNPYYQTFTIYLPEDSKSRMKNVFSGKVLTVKSLGAEDVLIMKLMAGRSKDMGHIKHLLKLDLNLKIVEDRLFELQKLFPKLANSALDLYYDLTDTE